MIEDKERTSLVYDKRQRERERERDSVWKEENDRKKSYELQA